MPFRRLLPFWGFLFLLSGLYALTGEDTIQAHYPCPEGSENEFTLIEFLIDEFSANDLNYSVIRYYDRDDLHSFSRSLRVDYLPEQQERLYIALSLNGSSDYSYLNTLILYNLALILGEDSPERGITLLFLGGERNRIPVGSAAFLEDFTGEETDSLIYLDLDSSSLRLISSTRGHNCPLWLLRSFSQALDREDISFSLDGMANLLNRAGFGVIHPLLAPWMSRDVPSLLLTGGEAGTNDSAGFSAASILASLKSYVKSPLPKERDNREKNYLILSWRGSFFFIGEWHSLLTIIALLSLFTITVVFQSRNFTLNFRKNKGNIWVLVLIFSLVFVLLYLSTLIMEEILLQKNIADLWTLTPRLVLFFKLLLTLLFSSFFLFIIRGIPIPRSPHFYSYGAILFAIADLLLLSSRDITLTYYALWLLLCLFPFSLTRKMIFKTFLTLLTPVPMLYLLTTVVLARYPDLSRYILMDRIEGNLVITAFLMPYILMLTSLHYSRYYYHRERRSYTALAVFTLVPAATIYILVRIILYSPFTEEIKQPYILTDRMDYAAERRTIELTSPQQMGTVELKYAGLTLLLNSLGEEATINGRLNDSYLSYQGEISSFLNRKRLLLRLQPEGRPISLEVRLYTDEGQITIYDCNFPYINRSDNRESRIIIGNNPLFPLDLDLTVTLETKPTLEFIMTYDDPPLDPPEILNKPAVITHRLILRDELDLSLEKGDYLFPEGPKK